MAHIPTARDPICPLCSQPVELESAETDDDGQPAHEGCYISKLASQLSTAIPERVTNA